MTAAKGDKITCANGHLIGEVLEDLRAGAKTGTWGECFGNWTQDDVPKVGSMHKPVCAICGAPFIAEDSWAFHYENGWGDWAS